MKKLLTKESILEIEDLALVEMEIPEWDGIVTLKPLTGEEKDNFEYAIFTETKEGKSLKNLRARLVAASVVNPDTKELLFTQSDVAYLGRKSGAALDRIFQRAQEINHMKKEDVEALTENLPQGQSEDGSLK